MNAFLGFAMFAGILVMVVAVIAMVIAAFRKRSKRKWVKILAVGAAMFIIPLIYGMVTETPEQRAAFQQKQQDKKAAQQEADNKKAQDKAARQEIEQAQEAQKENEPSELQNDDSEKAAQQIYDEQAEYEAWISQLEQQKYDEQAEYEDWVPKEIDRICKEQLSEGDELAKVEVNEDMSSKNFGSGKLIVLPYVHSQSGFKSAELMKVCKMMKALYSSDLPISEVTIFTQDMSGKTIMKSTMSADRASSIDWGTVEYNNFDSQLDKFWTVPSMR